MLGKNGCDGHVAEVYPEKGDHIINKKVVRCFQWNPSGLSPDGLSIEYVLVTGTVTHYLCRVTAKGAFNHGYFPVIVSDGVFFRSGNFIKELLHQFTGLWGRVMTSVEVIQELSE